MFLCSCGKDIDCQDDLHKHQEGCPIYTKDFKFKCDCGKKFKRLRGKASIRVHRKICNVWKSCSSKRKSDAAKKSFEKMVKEDPERIKRIRVSAGKKISKTIMGNQLESKGAQNY